MNRLEQMALLETLRDKVDAAYKAVRSEVFDEMVADGVDKARVKVAGVEVATATLRCDAVRVEDADAYADWCVENGLATEVRSVDFDRLPDDIRRALLGEVEERWPDYVGASLVMPDPRKLAKRGPGGTALTEGGEPIPGLRTNVPACVSLRDVADGRRGMNTAYVGGLITQALMGELAQDAHLIEGAA